MKRIVVALSGGVDSAVSAHLLKEEGYEVMGVHMQNWDTEVNEGITPDSQMGCHGAEDLKYVKQICEILDIPLRVYNFVPEYWEFVFERHLEDLRNNLNTNPDVFCNVHIKFGVLLDRVIEDFGEDIKLATGHWARIIEENNRFYLGLCSNPKKDQTYFLSSLREDKLSRIVFPLQNFTSKDEVRRIAKEIGIPNWDRRDSTGICFIGRRKYQDFISQFLEKEEGDFVDVETGEILGRHRGLHLYVLHQSSGLFLKGYEEKYYVCAKDPKKNIVFLCKKSKIQEFLHRSTTICINLNWINDPPSRGENLYIKARHTPDFLSAKIVSLSEDVCILFHESVFVTSPGQNIVFYDLKLSRCLGNGIYVDQ